MAPFYRGYEAQVRKHSFFFFKSISVHNLQFTLCFVWFIFVLPVTEDDK